jgi:hypothetical protein
MQQKFRGDLIPETTNLSHGREGKMKQQFRFLIAGFSLIGLLVYTATPASAQSDTTNFTVTLMSLSVSVTPGTIPLGNVSAGDTKESPTQGQSLTVSLGGATVDWYFAVTNTKQTGDATNAVVWRAIKNDPDTDQFRVCVTGGSQQTFLCAAGPKPEEADKFPNIGSPEYLGVALGSQTVNWQFTAPTTSQNNQPQEFNVVFAAAVTGAGGAAVTQAFQTPAPTGTTTSGATSPLTIP